MLDICIIYYFKVTFYSYIQYISHCINLGALTVFGGLDEVSANSTLQVLNGTTWVARQLKYPRYYHTMVLLPCP